MTPSMSRQLKKGIPISEYFKLKRLEKDIVNKVNKDVVFYSSVLPILATSAMQFTKINEAGNKILEVSQVVCYWIVTISAIVLIIKAAANHDKHKVGEILISSALIYGSIYIVPFVLDIIRDTFS